MVGKLKKNAVNYNCIESFYLFSIFNSSIAKFLTKVNLNYTFIENGLNKANITLSWVFPFYWIKCPACNLHQAVLFSNGIFVSLCFLIKN